MVSIDEIKKLAKLARIKLSDKEEEDLAKDVGSILGYVNELQELKIPESFVSKNKELDLVNVFRDDEVSSAKISDNVKEGPFKVKKIL